ncbi:hypothetical protein [Sinisalibacter aestuarii]|uniref:DUF3052 domain-containing protein n=1 Tax=Sinisalibacter aestuarii TaxID=2949426 RepID=A0ABQ5LPG4_9RHOB|nr:hypothetical protein [Sinisalibacter aestuarii]GKY86166.1 DUF3052 domain-containing protein [Sinisalibacter aestuarii]
MAGYSGKPLADKLGLQHGQRAGWVGLPASLSALPLSRSFARSDLVARCRDLAPGPFDMIHVFTMSRAMLESDLDTALGRLARDGMIWVSWPKKAAKLPTDVTEDVVRGLALEGPLVDVKVCAVDAIWSGLKLVIRTELR